MSFSSFFIRWWGIVAKELGELKHDQLSIGLIFIIPLMQIIMFGYAINTDAHFLPTAVVDHDKSSFSRNTVNALANTRYFALSQEFTSEEEAQTAMQQGKVKFIISIPAEFGRRIVRGDNAPFLIQADATDPTAIVNALAATRPLPEQILRQSLPATAMHLAAMQNNPINIVVQHVYNPESVTQYNVVPGLFGIVITMTLVLMSGLSVVREKEKGTMETLLATPARAPEIITGKITPYILISIAQAFLITLVSIHVFKVPMSGSYLSLAMAILLFIIASASVGVFLSVFARTQLQSLQLTFFYLLPSLLISGFIFPFHGMPDWAKTLGNLLATTHFFRLIRGIMLKGSSLQIMWADILPLMFISLVFLSLTIIFYKKRLN